jgi:hypothetical protein
MVAQWFFTAMNRLSRCWIGYLLFVEVALAINQSAQFHPPACLAVKIVAGH